MLFLVYLIFGNCIFGRAVQIRTMILTVRYVLNVIARFRTEFANPWEAYVWLKKNLVSKLSLRDAIPFHSLLLIKISE